MIDFFKQSDKKNDSERSEVGIQIDSGFLLGVLRELKDMNDGTLLVGTLQNLSLTLSKVDPGSFHTGDKLSYVLDDSLNVTDQL